MDVGGLFPAAGQINARGRMRMTGGGFYMRGVRGSRWAGWRGPFICISSKKVGHSGYEMGPHGCYLVAMENKRLKDLSLSI